MLASLDTPQDGLKLEREDGDAVKGILILAIVAGHNVYIGEMSHDVHRWLYTFHVAGFLLFPFLFDLHPLGSQSIRDVAVRHLVPMVWFVSISTTLYFIIFALPEGESLTRSFSLLGWAFLTATSASFNVACGFEMYWFLPALFSLRMVVSLFAWVWQQLSSHTVVRVFLLLCCVVVHVLIGELDMELPWGLSAASYILFLGLASRVIVLGVPEHRSGVVALLATITFVGASLVYFAASFPVNLGEAVLAGYGHPGRLLLQDLLIVGSFVALVSMGRLSRIPRFFAVFGRHSLAIYLCHGLVFQAFRLVVERSTAMADCPDWVRAAVSLVLTVGLSWGVGHFVAKYRRLRCLIFPRDYADLRSLGAAPEKKARMHGYRGSKQPKNSAPDATEYDPTRR